MKNILSSATKLVLLLVVVNLNVISCFAVCIGIYRGTLDPKDVLALFGSVVTGVIFFYFGKGMATSSQTTTSAVE
jgi:hypothetical protein